MTDRRSIQKLVFPAALLFAAGQPWALHAQEAPVNAPATAPTVPVAPVAAKGPQSPESAVALDLQPPVPASVAQPEKPMPLPAAPPTAPLTAAPQPITFAFKDAPWDQVLDFLARQTGLPMIFEAQPPAAPVTFISAQEYALPEALDIVNRMLWMHGLQVRSEPTILMLSKLDDAKARSRQLGCE